MEIILTGKERTMIDEQIIEGLEKKGLVEKTYLDNKKNEINQSDIINLAKTKMNTDYMYVKYTFKEEFIVDLLDFCDSISGIIQILMKTAEKGFNKLLAKYID